MIPVYKLEFYTGAVLDHIITSNAISIFTKESVTEAVGHFNVVLPLRKGSSKSYDDIALFDKVKVYYGYDSVGATPDFIGRVYKITSPVETDKGFVRQISGLSQGEILRRRIKSATYWDGDTANTIVNAVATDLSLGAGDIAADATAEVIECRRKTYFDLMREVSDYWKDAGNKVKKDFYVDVDNDLVWKARPIRTANVESFTLGDNILKYQVTRFLESVKNDIEVYGAAEANFPRDEDDYTEPPNPPTAWSADQGTVAQHATHKTGSFSIQGYTGALGDTLEFKRTITKETVEFINKLYFWSYSDFTHSGNEVRLLCPDEANAWVAVYSTSALAWTFQDLDLGKQHTYDAVTNPNGTWYISAGAPNWWDIQGLEFYTTYGTNSHYVLIDGLYFGGDRWEGTASDGTSKTAYGQRDLHVIFDKLHSDTECARRAETLLYQLKDPTVQIELWTYGNGNVLVGDRIAMTLADENISASNFDIASVEHTFINGGWTTKATMMDSENTRQPITGMVKSLYRNVREINIGIENVR